MLQDQEANRIAEGCDPRQEQCGPDVLADQDRCRISGGMVHAAASFLLLLMGATPFLSSVRVKDDFNIAIDALIKFVKGIGCLRERQAMRDDLTGFGTTGDEQITQLGVVALIRIAAHAHANAFAEEGGHGNEQIPMSFDVPDRPGIVGKKHANNAKASIGIDQTGQVMNHLIWLVIDPKPGFAFKCEHLPLRVSTGRNVIGETAPDLTSSLAIL